MRKYTCLLILLIMSSAAMADAPASPESAIAELLMRAQLSTLTTPMYYEETTYNSIAGDVQLTTRRVWQHSVNRFRAETVDHTGRTLLTIADGSQLWLIDTATQSVLRERLTDPLVQTPPSVPNGRSTVVHDQFAERPVQIVTVRRDRQTHRYTIDLATGVLLKEEILSPRGELVYMAYRSNLRFDEDFDPALFVFHPSPDYHVTHDRTAWRAQRIVRDLSGKSGFVVHVPKHLPTGYELLEGSVQHVEEKAVVALHFHNGRSVLSVFQQEETITHNMMRQLVRRLTSESGRELSASRQVGRERSYLAIGPFPESELDRVLASMKPLDGW